MKKTFSKKSQSKKRRLPVSVVVTVLNEAANIDELLDALAAQLYSPAEVIITDGGSVDDTWQKLQARRKKYPVPLVIRQVEGNRSVGRNAAIRLAKNQLIAITDAGCFPEPTWLAELVAAIPDPKVEEVVIAGYYTAYPQTKFEQAVIPYVFVMPDRVNPAAFLPATRSMLLSKAVWKTLDGFDPSLSDNEDYAFARKIRQQKIEITFTADARVVWQPRSNLKSFAWMIYRFARGDAYAGLWRPKVLLIFVRYLGLLALLILHPVTRILAIILTWGYVYWAIKKNQRYAPSAKYWLVVLQFTADLMVMAGTLAGFRNRWQQQWDQRK